MATVISGTFTAAVDALETATTNPVSVVINSRANGVTDNIKAEGVFTVGTNAYGVRFIGVKSVKMANKINDVATAITNGTQVSTTLNTAYTNFKTAVTPDAVRIWFVYDIDKDGMYMEVDVAAASGTANTYDAVFKFVNEADCIAWLEKCKDSGVIELDTP